MSLHEVDGLDVERVCGALNEVYEYAGNDPVNVVDSTGESWIVVAGGAAVVVLSSVLFMYAVHNDKDGAVYRSAVLDGNSLFPGQRTKSDAFRHCRSSCESASVFGSGIAKLIDTRDQKRADQGDASSMQDVYNNHQGRDACADLTSMSGRDRPTRAECTQECVRRVENGEVISWYE